MGKKAGLMESCRSFFSSYRVLATPRRRAPVFSTEVFFAARFVLDTMMGSQFSRAFSLASSAPTFCRLLPRSDGCFHVLTVVPMFCRLLPRSIGCSHVLSAASTFHRLLPSCVGCFHVPSPAFTFHRLLPRSVGCLSVLWITSVICRLLPPPPGAAGGFLLATAADSDAADAEIDLRPRTVIKFSCRSSLITSPGVANLDGRLLGIWRRLVDLNGCCGS